MAIGSAPARAASIATASAVPPGPWAYRPTGTPEASRSRPIRSPAAAGSSAPAGSCSSTRSAPSSERRRARSTSPPPPGASLYTSPAYTSAPASRTAAIGPTRSSTSFSGSCRRKMSIPDSAAHRMKRRTRSASAGRGPTRNVPRNAITSGVDVRALSARIRSHGLSTARFTAPAKQPPPVTSSAAYPALSRSSARRRMCAVEMRPTNGSCDRSRIDVSTRRATSWLRLATGSARRACRP